jgi:hypothetical protein
MYPEILQEEIRLFLKMNRVGELLSTLIPSQSPFTILMVVVPSMTSLSCAAIRRSIMIVAVEIKAGIFLMVKFIGKKRKLPF